MQLCTLCGNEGLTKIITEQDSREYYHCNNCWIIFADPRSYLSANEERSRYLNHNNSIEQHGYVQFLNRVVRPAIDFIGSGSVGLDYGCGPSPTISILLEREGFHCHNYDPFFFPELKNPPYDFIFSTETFEHFHHPGKELEKLLSMLNPEGSLNIMTELWQNIEQFKSWYYKRDPTHVSFFHKKTFAYINQKYGLSELYDDHKRVIILRKSSK